MPNYRYRMPDYDRRNGYNNGHSMTNCQRQQQMQQETARAQEEMKERISCQVPERPGGLENMAIAMAYVPWQKWKNLYSQAQGFQMGTIFKDLDKPFRGMGGAR